jgi:hypothetical protein
MSVLLNRTWNNTLLDQFVPRHTFIDIADDEADTERGDEENSDKKNFHVTTPTFP